MKHRLSAPPCSACEVVSRQNQLQHLAERTCSCSGERCAQLNATYYAELPKEEEAKFLVSPNLVQTFRTQWNSVGFCVALSMNSVGIPGGFRGNTEFSGKFGVWGGFG